jgi:hypothetical protein
MHLMRQVDPPRPLSDKEEEVLHRLLSQPFPGRQTLQQQAQSALVSAECEEGCPAIEMLVHRSSSPPAEVSSRIPIEGTSTGQSGDLLVIYLYVTDGYLSDLEVTVPPGAVVTDWPDPASIELVNYWADDPRST